MMPGPLPIAPLRVVLRTLRRSADLEWWRVPALIVVLLAAAAAGVVGPLAIGAVIDHARASDVAADARLVWILGTVMAAAVVVGAVLGAVGVVASSALCERTLAVIRERMVEAAFALPQERVEAAGTGDLVARAGDDVAEVSDAVPRVVPALVGALFTIVVTIVGMTAIDPWYGLATLVIVPLHVIAVRRYLRTAPAVYAAERAAMSERAQHLLEALRGIGTVRAYGLQGPIGARVGNASWQVVRWTMRARGIQNVFFARLNGAEYAGMAALLVTGFVLVSTGLGTLGGATAAILLFIRLFGPINQLLFVVDDLQSALASLGRMIGVIDAAADAPEPTVSAARSEGGTAAPAGDGTVDTVGWRMSGVSFAYADGPEVVRDVTLEVAPGETVALVGASGAGKSTLAAIAAGIHRPSRGDVARPSAVALVTQEVHVFDGSLRENLTLAAPDADDAALRAALETVGGDGILARLPEGLAEPVGASGTVLLAAEAQQVALARVLLKDPDAVVLDEATAEAGSADAGVLDAAADAAVRGRTALVIAHRLSQAARADRVVLMDAGRVVEAGSHAELVARGGRYARLWEAWRAAPGDAGA